MVFEQARKDIVAILKKAGLPAAPADLMFPPDPKMADLSFGLFVVAKEKKISAGDLAQEIQHKLQPQGLVDKIETTGPYVNFWLKRGEVTRRVIPSGKKGKKGPFLFFAAKKRNGPKERIMLEMVSPNTNKPLHLGHLRNAFLGESVCRLMESQGAKVIRSCLFSDRGLHIAKAMLGYKRWGRGKTPQSERVKGDEFVVQWYVRFEQEAKKNPELNRKAEELVRLWEAGDKATLALWEKMTDWALKGIEATLKRLGIKFSTRYFESKLWKLGKKKLEQGLRKGIFKKDKSGVVAAEFKGLPPKVIQRADGTAIYATADLALGPEKFKKYKLTRSIWCVGQEQDLYFKQLFAIYRMLGYKWADLCEHLSYGLVFLPEGKMKTREGTVVEADPLLDKMAGLVKEEIKVRHTHLGERETKERAEVIAQAAVRYFLLKVSPRSPMHFDPKASLALTGDTGPYLLYTYARIASILRKAQKTTSYVLPTAYLTMDLEWALTMSITSFPEIVAQAASGRNPSHLAKHLYTLAQKFSDFYEQVPVLKAEPEARAFRLALIRAVQNTLKQGLRLLTIDTVEEM